MKLKAKRKSLHATVDMTPMLDVVFQLIIFFLVSTTFASLPGLKLTLPESTTAESTSNLGITISAEKSGNIWFNETPVKSDDELESLLKSYDTKKVKKPEFPITIEADSDVTNGTIVRLFDVVRKSGYSVISLRTTDAGSNKKKK